MTRAPATPDAPRVLLVEDQPDVLYSLSRLVKRLGYAVDATDSGHRALAAMDRQPYAAIVCDMRMPRMSGPELFARVRAEFPHLADRMIFTSGDLHDPAAQAFLAECGRPALEKPFHSADFISILAGTVTPAMAESKSERRRAS